MRGRSLVAGKDEAADVGLDRGSLEMRDDVDDVVDVVADEKIRAPIFVHAGLPDVAAFPGRAAAGTARNLIGVDHRASAGSALVQEQEWQPKQR